VEDAGSRFAAGSLHPAAHGGAGAAAAPHVVDDQDAPVGQQNIAGELQELGQGEQLGGDRFFREVHGGGQHVADVQRLRQQAAGDDAAPGDHDHRVKMGDALNLRHKDIDQLIHISPSQHFVTNRPR